MTLGVNWRRAGRRCCAGRVNALASVDAIEIVVSDD